MLVFLTRLPYLVIAALECCLQIMRRSAIVKLAGFCVDSEVELHADVDCDCTEWHTGSLIGR